jgi:hypothetical protein
LAKESERRRKVTTRQRKFGFNTGGGGAGLLIGFRTPPKGHSFWE